MESLCNKVCRKLQHSADTKINIFPYLDLVKVHPELRLCLEYEFGSLPRTMFTPEICKTTESAPSIRKIVQESKRDVKLSIICRTYNSRYNQLNKYPNDLFISCLFWKECVTQKLQQAFQPVGKTRDILRMLYL